MTDEMTGSRMQQTSFDVLIVGAGPAGMAAAAQVAAFGMTVALVDENASAGGQIYRNVASPPSIDRAVLGPDYFRGAALTADLDASGATILAGSAVWMIQPDPDSATLSVGIAQDGVARILHARKVLIATGAQERPFPIKGWTVPGVMTAGAAQTMLKASGVVPAGKVVLAGTGPLLYLLAAQLVRASVPPLALLDTTPRRNWLKAAPYAPGFAASSYVRKGLGLLAEVRRTVPVIGGVTALAAIGDQQLRSVEFTAKGQNQRIEVDTLLLHQGVVPHVNLAMAAGCAHQWSEERLAFEPILDKELRSTVPGLSIAGDGGAIAGAIAAEITGRIAALHIVDDLGALSKSDLLSRLKPLRRQLGRALRGRRFIDALYRPAEGFRIPADDVMVCRCEEVEAGAVRRAITGGAQGPSQLKTFLRTGMGPCQGRLCGLTVTEILAQQLGKSPGEIGYFHLRNPVKPITLGALAALKGEGETTRLF